MIGLSDDALLNGIRASNREVIGYVYSEFFPAISHLITGNSGTQHDAEDIFQDALVIIYKKVSQNELILTSSFKTYLYSVCRNLWLQRLDRRTFQTDDIDLADKAGFYDSIQFEFADTESEKEKIYQENFLKLSQDCQKILRLFMSKTSLREIAEEMGFASEKYAKTRKFMCKEKLREWILNDPRFKKYFNDET
jgi:RNA polymerase sigma factor (sigma-70 family)